MGTAMDSLPHLHSHTMSHLPVQSNSTMKRRAGGDPRSYGDGSTTKRPRPEDVPIDDLDEKITADDDDGGVQEDVPDAVDDIDDHDDEKEDAMAPDELVLSDDLAIGGERSWRRPALPDIDPAKDSIAFQNLDIDYFVAHSPLDPSEYGPILRLYGVTDHGNSVTAYIHGVKPYFYVPAWPGFTPRDCPLFMDRLNDELRYQCNDKHVANPVLSVSVVRKQSIWGYHFGEETDFLRITLAIPSFVATARRVLQNGLSIGKHGTKSFLTYESNIPFALRLMVDLDMRGGAWVEVPANTYAIRDTRAKQTHCQLEVDLAWTDLVVHQPEGEWLKIAPIRILSFDIECAGRKNHFPHPDHDPVIQIASIVSVHGSDQPVAKNVFTLRTCASIIGAQVLEFETEEEMLAAWRKYFVAIDPDIITGYNITNFDLPYLLNRAQALQVKEFSYIGRVINKGSRIKETTFSSKAYGTRENKDINIEGRVQFDLLMVIRREYKLRSYTLNAVSAHFLKQQKEDVHYSIISDLFNGNEETRRRLAVYCLKDAVLPQQLADKLMLIVNYIEMARVTGVPISYLLTRGQQIKVVSQLYRKAMQHNFVLPVKERANTDDEYEGAVVIEPKRGFYTQPIATLDFASLYPSIMMAHNLCYTTLLSPQDAQRLDPKDVCKTPTGHLFVKASVHGGLLPAILKELLSARKRAKKDLKAATDPFVKAVLNGRQLALKISANSVYGFTGAQVGQLPCLPISSSVTAFGREMITLTKRVVEERYSIKNGHPYDSEVVYGDTDSVMVRFGLDDMKQTMQLGVEAAEFVSGHFDDPIRLEFEKVYYPYLLMNKKRYAGLYWTNPNKWDKMDTKGIETVRRDNCALVKNVITTCLEKILIDRSVKAAVEYTKGMISDLLQNRLDLSLLVISKSLGKSASSEGYTAKQAHVELAERMRQRDPSTAPVVGDRVPYVIIKAAKGAPAYTKSEDPIYVLDNNLPIDHNYYLEKQLKGPLTRIFEPIMKDVGQLFSGDHTRHIKMSTPSVGGIMRFAVKARTCFGCKAVLRADEKTVCKHCEANEASLYLNQLEKTRTYEKLFSQVWSQCQRCQGSLHQDVLCTSRDCPIFYRRKKVQKDLTEAQAALQRFDLSF